MARQAREPEDSALDSPINIRLGTEVLDWGIATIPKAVLRFYRYLECDGERLRDVEMMPLILLLTLGADHDFQLRLGNLPSASATETIQRKYLPKWRRMGLVQTTRQYYSAEELIVAFGADNIPLTPRLKCVTFDLSGLIYNILLVAKEWTRQQHEAVVAWENSNQQGHRPVYQFSHDFVHEVVLSYDQARAIRQGAYQYVPPKWVERAQQTPDSVAPQPVPVRNDVAPQPVPVRDHVPPQPVPVRNDVAPQPVPVRDDVAPQPVPVRPRTAPAGAGHLESSVSTDSFVSNVSTVFPANAGAQSAHSDLAPAVKNKNSLPASSVTGLPEEYPAGRDVKGPVRPAEQQPQGREVPDLPQEHPAQHTTAGHGRQSVSVQGPASEAEAAWKPLSSTEGLTVPEKVRYWEAAVARAKHNPGGCLCRAVNDLLGLKPNYGHAGKLAKEHGRMEVWRQVKKALLDPPQGDFWAYIARALENGDTATRSGPSPSALLHAWQKQENRPENTVSDDPQQEDTSTDPAAQLWADILDWLNVSMTPAFFATHLKNAPALRLQENGDGQQLFVQVRSSQAKIALTERLGRQIQLAVSKVVDYPLQIVFCCEGEEVA